MSKLALVLGALFMMVALQGCGQEGTEEPPKPFELTSSATGHYCGMTVMEHAGPKGQVILASQSEPVWFSSARDTIAFTILPEEPKDISAIYVSDMAKAASWKDPGANNWVDARKAHFVIGSTVQGGMGAPETVPFSDRAAADKFVAEHGGRIVTFDQIPQDYVLSSEPGPSEGTHESGH